MKINSRINMDSSLLKPEDLSGVYREIAEAEGIETALRMHSIFRGQTVSFPVEILSRTFIEESIRSEYNGSNVKQLAAKYAYSEKWIRKIVKN